MLNFLPTHVRAFVFVMLALAAGGFLLRWAGFDVRERRTWFRAWLVLTFAAFFGGHFLLYAAVLAIVVTAVARKGVDARLGLFFAVLPLMPLFGYTLPGPPGINQLIALDHFRVLVLCALLPVMLSRMSPVRGKVATPGRRTSVDRYFMGYYLWLLVLAVVHRPSVTDTLRGALEVSLFLAVPFFALRRLVVSGKDFEKVLQATVFAAVLVSCIGMMEQYFRWSFYDYIPNLLKMDPAAAFAFAKEERFGFVRITATVGGGGGYFFTFFIGAVVTSYRMKLISRKLMFPLLFLTGSCLVFTGSRGPWIAAAMMLAVMCFFGFIKTPGRLVMTALVALVGAPALSSSIVNADDPFGTFSYREQLLESSIPMILQKPILGWGGLQAVEDSGQLEHLRQGQGIIDIVNSYIGEALTGGLPQLILFASILFSALWVVVRRQKQDSEAGVTKYEPLAAFLAGFIISTIFLIATVSLVGYIFPLIILVSALCGAFAARRDDVPSEA